MLFDQLNTVFGTDAVEAEVDVVAVIVFVVVDDAAVVAAVVVAVAVSI